jgi:antitoxin (DNA-binding transcriptional repressor) of toxin-antitoxin stability system
MTAVSITEAKNNLSKLLKKVKHGESVLILDRKVPVACLEPLPRGSKEAKKAHWAELERRGLVRPPRRKLPKDFWTRPRPKTRDGSSVLQTLLDERAESR